jgi:hypothetical protein
MEIIDNFLDKVDYINIRDYVFGNSFNWNYTSTVSVPPEYWINIKDKNCKETDGFFHNVFHIDRGYTNPAEPFYPIFKKLESLGYKPEDLLVFRLGMKFPKEGFDHETYQLPHVDYPKEPNDTLIYYLNTSDGETRLFDQYHDDTSHDTFTVKEKIKPIDNRALLFDGFQYHTAANPIDTDRRVVININLRKRKHND